jgi:hypothetical protein
MTDKKTRGSDLLADTWTEQDLERLVAADADGVKLVEYFPKGIPAPDGGWGTYHVKPDALAALIQSLTQHNNVPGIWIFPKGIPRPDLFEVGFAAGSARAR